MFTLSVIAYRIDGRTTLLIISIAYALLLLHCVLWILGTQTFSAGFSHTVFHNAGVLFLVPVILLVFLAIKRGAFDG